MDKAAELKQLKLLREASRDIALQLQRANDELELVNDRAAQSAKILVRWNEALGLTSGHQQHQQAPPPRTHGVEVQAREAA